MSLLCISWLGVIDGYPIFFAKPLFIKSVNSTNGYIVAPLVPHLLTSLTASDLIHELMRFVSLTPQSFFGFYTCIYSVDCLLEVFDCFIVFFAFVRRYMSFIVLVLAYYIHNRPITYWYRYSTKKDKNRYLLLKCPKNVRLKCNYRFIS